MWRGAVASCFQWGCRLLSIRTRPRPVCKSAAQRAPRVKGTPKPFKEAQEAGAMRARGRSGCEATNPLLERPPGGRCAIGPARSPQERPPHDARAAGARPSHTQNCEPQRSQPRHDLSMHRNCRSACRSHACAVRASSHAAPHACKASALPNRGGAVLNLACSSGAKSTPMRENSCSMAASAAARVGASAQQEHTTTLAYSANGPGNFAEAISWGPQRGSVGRLVGGARNR